MGEIFANYIPDKKITSRGFPGGPVVKNLPDNAGTQVWPLVRKIPHATGQQSP